MYELRIAVIYKGQMFYKTPLDEASLSYHLLTFAKASVNTMGIICFPFEIGITT